MTPKATIYLRGLPRHLKDQFKGVANGRGDDMTKVLVALMKAYVKDPSIVRVDREVKR